MHVHRLKYMIHTHCIQLNSEYYYVSQLCHTKTCINISHLSLEPPHVPQVQLPQHGSLGKLEVPFFAIQRTLNYL